MLKQGTAVSALILLLVAGFSLGSLSGCGIETAQEEVVSKDHGELGPAFQDRTSWYGVYLQGQKVGWSMSQLKRHTNDNQDFFRLNNDNYLKLIAGGRTIESTINMQIEFTPDLEPLAFTFVLSSAVFQLDVRGVRDGDVMKVTMKTPHGSKQEEYSLTENLDMLGLADFRRAAEGYKVGDVFEGEMFNPEVMGVVSYKIEVYDSNVVRTGSTSETLFNIRTTMGDVVSTSIVAQDGVMIHLDGPMGITMKKESEELARDLESIGGLTDLYLGFAIPANKYISHPSKIKRAVLKVGGLSDYKLASSGAQDVTFDSHSGEALVRVNLVAIPKEKIEADVLALELAPTTFIQSDDSRVIRAAANIVGKSQDNRKNVGAIMNWVYGAIKKEPTFTIPSTVDVLETLVGDCNEHAALFSGLARASGIPTRIAAGVVYFNGSFAYHAWNEVYLDDGWVPVDATFNEFPAGALRLRMVTGDLNEQIRIAKLAGKISIEIIEADEGAPSKGESSKRGS